MRFLVASLCVGLFGSRFGIAFGTSRLSIVAPVVLVLAAVAFWRGVLRFHRVRLAFFALLCATVLSSMAVNAIEPDRFQTGFSATSLAQFLLLTSIFTLRFTEPVGDRTMFQAVNTVISVVAVAGLLQFFAQFAGLSLFTFRDFLPDKLSFETGYNMQIPIGGTRLFKSNGFFLLEPSMFSQFMALGLAIEVVALRRPRVVLLMLAGLLVSMAGTGWMILAAFIVALACGMGVRGMVLALATVSLLGGLMTVLAFVASDLFNSFFDRIGEFSAPGSSGHDRFIAPFWVVQDVLWRAPWAIWSGIGAGAGERMSSLVYEQSLNTPTKILVEYGAPTLLAYLALLVSGRRPRSQAVLVVPALAMLLITGSYAQTPPILYPLALLVCVATLVPEERIESRNDHLATVVRGSASRTDDALPGLGFTRSGRTPGVQGQACGSAHRRRWPPQSPDAGPCGNATHRQ